VGTINQWIAGQSAENQAKANKVKADLGIDGEQELLGGSISGDMVGFTYRPHAIQPPDVYVEIDRTDLLPDP
jgi:hypothetical protein